MSISPVCDKCKEELKDFGAILLGPPDSQDMAHKEHLCVSCYQEIKSLFD